MNHGRAFGADSQWGGWKIRIVGGHAEPSGDRVPYQESVDDMDAIMEDTPLDHIIIMGVDAQTCLGPRKAFDCNDTIGGVCNGTPRVARGMPSETSRSMQTTPASDFRRGL